MRWLRFLNPLYTLDLERKVASIPGLRRAVRSLAESVRRQALPGESTELRAKLLIIADDLAGVRQHMQYAEHCLKHGRTSEALHELQTALGSTVEQREAS